MKYKIIDSEMDLNRNKSENAKDYGIIIPEWTLSEIVLSHKIRDTFDDIISFCNNKEKIINEWGLKKFLKGKGGTVGINFFGAPGTGKSIAAEGLAKEIGMNLIKADYSEIIDSLFGGTEKKLTELFEKAERNNAIIFFDEADGLLSKRQSGSKTTESSNQIKSHLLTLLDKSNIVIIFATNFFENYDKAFFRRILFHVEFEMPNKEQRMSIWRFHLDETVPKDITYEELANASENLAGGDIKNLALKLCIKLSANKINSISIETLNSEIEKYKKSLAASEGVVLARDLPKEIEELN